MGRDAVRLCRTQTRRVGDRRRTDAVVQVAARRLQGAAPFRVRGDTEDQYGEDTEVQAKGNDEGGVR